MARFQCLARLILICLPAVPATSAFAAGPSVFHNARHDTSQLLSQLANRAGMPSNRPDREMAEPRATREPLSSGRADAVAKTATCSGSTPTSAIASHRRLLGRC
jgi:hypothetical protein